MLLKYGARNYYCFREGIEISLKLGNKSPEAISRGKSVSNLLCIKGSNGAGKTNVLKILSFLKEFCCNSFSTKPEQDIWIHSFFNNDEPIDLFCDFILSGVEYHYELSLTSKKVLSEILSRKVNRQSTVFVRKDNNLTNCIEEFSDLKKVINRKNASLISTAHQYEIKSIIPIYQFFNSFIVNVQWLGLKDFSSDYKIISKYYNDNPKILDTARSIIKEFDLGIVQIEMNKLKDADASEYYYPLFEHDAKVKLNKLTYYDESRGTQTLFLTLPYYLYAINMGGILVMDEFDTDYHPHMLKKLVSYFDDEKFNVNNAQMIFSTHNTEIIDYMGKYRTVFINKDSSESYGYRLDEIPGDIIRNDRSITPVYNSGRIGGVPRI